MKKIISLLILSVMAITLFACSAPSSEIAGISNPIKDSSAEEIKNLDGIVFNLPENIDDAVWHRIDTDPVMDEVIFTYEGDEYCVRAQETQALEDISGINYEWSESDGGYLPLNSAQCYVSKEGFGILYWYDNGHSFSISMSENAAAEKLSQMYNSLYI